MSIKIHSFAGTAANVLETSIYMAKADKLLSSAYDRIVEAIHSFDYCTEDVALTKGFLLAVVCYAMRKVKLPTEKQQYAYTAAVSVLTKEKTDKAYTKEVRRSDITIASMGKGAFSGYAENGIKYSFSDYSLTKEINTFANYYYSCMDGQKFPCYFWQGDRKLLEQNPLLIGTAQFVDGLLCDALEITKTSVEGKDEWIVEDPLDFEELEDIINEIFIPIYNVCSDLYGKYEITPLLQSKDSLTVNWEKIMTEASKIKTDNKDEKLIVSHIQQNENDVLYCRKCGKQIPVDSAFCKYCGTKVD